MTKTTEHKSALTLQLEQYAKEQEKLGNNNPWDLHETSISTEQSSNTKKVTKEYIASQSEELDEELIASQIFLHNAEVKDISKSPFSSSPPISIPKGRYNVAEEPELDDETISPREYFAKILEERKQEQQLSCTPYSVIQQRKEQKEHWEKKQNFMDKVQEYSDQRVGSTTPKLGRQDSKWEDRVKGANSLSHVEKEEQKKLSQSTSNLYDF